MAKSRNRSKFVKGITRAEWCRQISRLPRSIKPENKHIFDAKAAMMRGRQMAKNGALFGRVSQRHVIEVERQSRGVDLSYYREAVDA